MGLETKLPCFRRAREYHLYDDNGKRYLDLYLNNGRAIMGHRPGSFSKTIKNSLSRGLWADYPIKHLRSRLEKLLKQCFPQFPHFTLFRNQERALSSLGIESLKDPLHDSEGKSWRWRPLLDINESCHHLFVQAPLGGFIESQIILSKSELPEGDTVSPVILEGMTRLFHDLKAWLLIEKNIREFGTIKGFIQNGPYLIWKSIPKDYPSIYNDGIKKGLFLPPSTDYPLMIPLEMSDHEYKLLYSFLGDIFD